MVLGWGGAGKPGQARPGQGRAGQAAVEYLNLIWDRGGESEGG